LLNNLTQGYDLRITLYNIQVLQFYKTTQL
jgi:hypothetical protein